MQSISSFSIRISRTIVTRSIYKSQFVIHKVHSTNFVRAYSVNSFERGKLSTRTACDMRCRRHRRRRRRRRLVCLARRKATTSVVPSDLKKRLQLDELSKALRLVRFDHSSLSSIPLRLLRSGIYCNKKPLLQQHKESCLQRKLPILPRKINQLDIDFFDLNTHADQYVYCDSKFGHARMCSDI